MYDAIIIGGGHNGLTAAAYPAKAGRKVLVLEGRHILGGAATHPGAGVTGINGLNAALKIIKDRNK